VLSKHRGVVVSVGAVGGNVGATHGAGGSGGGSPNSQAVTPSAGAAAVGEHSANEVSKTSDDEQKSAGVQPQSMNINMNNNVKMSTKDFMQLRQTSKCGGSQDASMIDFKKLIEMIIAIKLLKTMNESSGK